MNDLYDWFDYIAGKEWWANTGNVDATFENLEAQSRIDNTIFSTVLSAMREEDTFNTTKILVEVGELLAGWDTPKAIKRINDLKDLHIYLLDKNHSDLSDREVMREFIIDSFHWLLAIVSQRDKEFVPSEENDYCVKTKDWLISLKWFWEVFCAQFYKKLCDIRWIDIGLLDISSQSNPIVGQSSEEKTFSDALDFFREYIGDKLVSWKNLIIPGYIWWIQWWIENAIWEGYSDATAALTAVTVKELLWEDKRVLLEVLKSVRWIMTTDPRLLEWSEEVAQVIREINFWVAKEIVWERGGQAKLLNSFVTLPQVTQSWIEVRLRNPQIIGDKGTLISNNTPNKKGVEIVPWRQDIAIISMDSFSMSQWFIAKISTIIKKYTSVDVISTSETNYTFSVDMKSWAPKDRLEEMIQELEKTCLNKTGDVIIPYYNAGLIFCIGHDMNQPGIFEIAGAAMREAGINTMIISQWASQRALTIGVKDWNDVQKCVQLLHEKFELSKIS